MLNYVTAQTVLIPKGEDNEPCIAAFQAETGIEVPAFPDERLKVQSEGRTFYLLKGEDIPPLLARGFGDVGLAGTDACSEYMLGNWGMLQTRKIGNAMCRFSLLAEKRNAERMRSLIQPSGRMVSAFQVASRRPRMLTAVAAQQDLPLVPALPSIRGSEEVIFSLMGLELGAAIVVSGDTALQNDVCEIRTLCDVYPEIIIRSSDANV